MKLNEKVKERIKRLRLKQIEVSREIGCTDSQLSKFINGWEPLPLKYQVRLTSFLNIDHESNGENESFKK